MSTSAEIQRRKDNTPLTNEQKYTLRAEYVGTNTFVLVSCLELSVLEPQTKDDLFLGANARLLRKNLGLVQRRDAHRRLDRLVELELAISTPKGLTLTDEGKNLVGHFQAHNFPKPAD